jgi:imidazolonepropionase-like amidohydrolase
VAGSSLRADLVVLDADPLADPGVLLDPARVRLVLRAGRFVAGADLERDPIAG